MTRKICPKCFEKYDDLNVLFCEKCGTTLDLEEYIQEKKFKKGIKDTFKSLLNMKSETDEINQDIEKLIRLSVEFPDFEKDYENLKEEYITPQRLKEFKGKYEEKVSKFENINHTSAFEKDDDLNANFLKIKEQVKKLNKIDETVKNINQETDDKIEDNLLKLDKFNEKFNKINSNISKSTQKEINDLSKEYKDVYNFFNKNLSVIDDSEKISEIDDFSGDYEKLDKIKTELEVYNELLEKTEKLNSQALAIKKLNSYFKGEIYIDNSKKEEIQSYNHIRGLREEINELQSNFDLIAELDIELNPEIAIFLSNLDSLDENIRKNNADYTEHKLKEDLPKLNQFNETFNRIKSDISKSTIREIGNLFKDYEDVYSFFNENLSLLEDFGKTKELDNFLKNYRNLDQLKTELEVYNELLEKTEKLNSHGLAIKKLNSYFKGEIYIDNSKKEEIQSYNHIGGLREEINELQSNFDLIAKPDLELNSEIAIFLSNLDNLDENIKANNREYTKNKIKKNLFKIKQFNKIFHEITYNIPKSSQKEIENLSKDYEDVYIFFNENLSLIDNSEKINEINNFSRNYRNLDQLKTELEVYNELLEKTEKLNSHGPAIKKLNNYFKGKIYINNSKKEEIQSYNHIGELREEITDLESMLELIPNPEIELKPEIVRFLSNLDNLDGNIRKNNADYSEHKLEEDLPKINQFNETFNRIKSDISKSTIREIGNLFKDYEDVYSFFNENLSLLEDCEKETELDNFLKNYRNLDQLKTELEVYNELLEKTEKLNSHGLAIKKLNSYFKGEIYIDNSKKEEIQSYNHIGELKEDITNLESKFNLTAKPKIELKPEIVRFLSNLDNLDENIKTNNRKYTEKKLEEDLPKINQFNETFNRIKSDIIKSTIREIGNLFKDYGDVYSFFNENYSLLEGCGKNTGLDQFLKNYKNSDQLKTELKVHNEILENIEKLNSYDSIVRKINNYFKGEIYVDYPKKEEIASYKHVSTSINRLRKKIFSLKSKLKITAKPNTKANPETIKFVSNFENLDKNIESNNKKYTKKELKENEEFFDDIEGKSLDKQQRLACVCDEENLQIIAGAGSGKTLTMVAKAKYLIEKKGVSPEDIVYISYTNASVNDLKKRMPEGTRGYTFHGLGRHVLKENQKPSRPYEYLLKDFLKLYFKEYVVPDTTFKDILTFYAFYPYSQVTPDDTETLGEALDMKEGMQFKTLRDLYGGDNEKITMDNKTVKSLEELIIANYFFVHQIKYEYEKPYNKFAQKYSPQREFIKNTLAKDISDEIVHHETVEIIINLLYKMQYKTLEYKPDFYLPEYDIYLEHFGVNRDCEASFLNNKIERQKYKDGIIWKKNIHKDYGSRLIETYSYYMYENRLLGRLEEKLKAENVTIKPIDYDYLLEELAIRNEVNTFEFVIDLIIKFIELFKGNHYTASKFNEFRQENENSDRNDYNKKRCALFLDIVEDVYLKYEEHKHEVPPKNSQIQYDMIDFNDMINNATDLIRSSEMNSDLNCKYIIVDEYQDTSHTRYELLKEVQKYTGAKVCVVGDDWQSIYRFTGCDITLFSNFEAYFPHHKKIVIGNTYRNSQELIDIAGNFIMKNDEQYEKRLYSPKHTKKPIKIAYFNIEAEEEKLFEYLINKCAEVSNDILILGRNNNDINKFVGLDKNDEEIPHSNSPFRDIEKDPDRKFIKINYDKNKDLDITFRTVHSSKGLESDNVILINLQNHIAGFPNKMVNDEVMEFVIDENDRYPFAEERRLFYVALTRTKNNVYLLVPKLNKSKFIEEIEEECETISDGNLDSIKHLSNEKLLNGTNSTNIPMGIKCPHCETGDLKLVVYRDKEENIIKQFIACSHSHCTFRAPYYRSLELLEHSELCPKCNGIMEVENWKYGAYLRCTKKDCKETKNITGEKLEITTKILNREDKRRPHETTKTHLKCPQCGEGDVVLISTRHRNHFDNKYIAIIISVITIANNIPIIILYSSIF